MQKKRKEKEAEHKAGPKHRENPTWQTSSRQSSLKTENQTQDFRPQSRWQPVKLTKLNTSNDYIYIAETKPRSVVYLPVTVFSNHGNREILKHKCGWTEKTKLLYSAATLAKDGSNYYNAEYTGYDHLASDKGLKMFTLKMSRKGVWMS